MRKRKAAFFPVLTLGLVGFGVAAGVFFGLFSEKDADPSLSVRLRDSANHSVVVEGRQKAPVLVHFWAAWCEPCKTELPAFLNAVGAIPGDWRVLAISLDPNWDEARAFLKNLNVPVRVEVALDPDYATANRFGSFQYPETYLLDADLVVRSKWVGPQSWTEPAFLQALVGSVDQF